MAQYDDANILYDQRGLSYDGFVVVPSQTTGRIVIGRFVPETSPEYTIENEIISPSQISEDKSRVNVVVIDGNVDSWTEYDRDDLIARDDAVNTYLDLPELMSPGEVRQRALDELRSAEAVNSPGGECAWQPWFSQKDVIYWIDEYGQKYQETIEGLEVEFDFTEQPYQRCTIDPGNVIVCDDDTNEDYFARDLFERTGNLGDAAIGGAWTTS